MLDDAGYKFKLNFDEELWSEIAKKSIFQKKFMFAFNILSEYLKKKECICKDLNKFLSPIKNLFKLVSSIFKHLKKR